MKRFLTSKRSGMTLIETLVAATLLSLALVSTLYMLTTSLSLWAKGSSGTTSNLYASLAMRKMVLDVQEGSRAVVAYEGTTHNRLIVTFPYFDAGSGTYVRTIPGLAAVYYLSGDTGSESTGYNLWKIMGGNKTLIGKNIDAISLHASSSGTLVRMEIRGRDPEHGGTDPRILIQSVKLRNT